MRSPAWLTDFKSVRNKGILAGVGVALLLALFVVRHHEMSISKLTSQSGSNVAATLEGSKTAATASSTTTSTLSQTTSTSSPTAKKVAVKAIDPAPPSTPPSVIAARSLDAAGANLLKSSVNIVCVSADSRIPSISGSGVIIDSRGIILTAAHVAQLFLLQDYLGSDKVGCLIRTGSPARRAYLAEPIYVSPTWVTANPSTLTSTSPRGTGENDFALLAITDTATSTPLPGSYPPVPLATDEPQPQEQVGIGSYGAQYLTVSELNYSLYPILVFGSIQDRYTYRTNTIDLVSVIGSAASQEGSSGGGLIDSSGHLIGTITTSSISGTINTRSLNAITIGHMRRSFEADTGQSLDSVLASESLSQLVSNFRNESKTLGAVIYRNL